MQNEDKHPIPTPYDFLVKLPLYRKIKIEEEKVEEILEIMNFRETIDTFCPECKEHSIFSRKGTVKNYYDLEDITNSLFFREYKCSRNHNHILTFLYSKTVDFIEKVGQTPSLADLHTFDIQKYSKVLNKKYFTEFTKAIGLSSHGVGVGSFVYLRRIFEFLIHEAYLKNKDNSGWNELSYKQADMSEKINILKADLPYFLVENKSIYSILSQGIHELEEQECLEFFPILKLSIEYILDEKLVILQRQKKESETKKALSTIQQKLKKTDKK